MLIKNLKYFILSLHGVKQLTILGPNKSHDYDPLSIAGVGQCERDYKAIVNHTGWMVAVRHSSLNGWMIEFSTIKDDSFVFRVNEYIFAESTFRPWKYAEDLSNDAQAWLRPGGAS